MKKPIAGFQEYKRPDDEPFAAPGITVHSFLDSDTQKRKIAIDGIPITWPKKKCPVCGVQKWHRSKVCRSCYMNIRRIMVPLQCLYCGSRFERIVSEIDKMHRRGHTDVYCSKPCSQAHHSVKHRRRCVACGKRTPKKTSKYCSKQCRASRRKKELEPKVCSTCGTEFQPKSYRTAYCSRPCANKAHSRRMRGAGNSHYKTGTSYAAWFRSMRPIILERDGHSCVACGRTEKLIVHHIDHVPMHNQSNNLITLCATCHAVHHKSKVSPFPWLSKAARERLMTDQQRSSPSSWKPDIPYVFDVYKP